MLFATENHHDNYALPAEWAPQSAVQLTWPHENSDWNYCLDAITLTFVELVRAIVPFEPVLIVTPNVEQTRARLMADLSADLLTDLKFVQAASNDTWARDHALITLQGKNGNLFLNFCFNGWGEKFPSDLDNAINRRVFEAGILDGRMEEHADFVLEGGAIESDGKGTVFTTSQCLLAPRRNQPLGQKEIEQKLKEFLRADRIVWLDYGNLTGDDTDGHIDTIVRCAPDDTLVYVGCENPDDEQYHDFQMLKKQLEDLQTTSGKAYRLLELPMPEPIFDEEGNRLPATYANFLIVNNAVICPTYNQPTLDRQALEVIAEAFPNRKIIPLDARTIILQHGSIHCLTMQFPAGAFTKK